MAYREVSMTELREGLRLRLAGAPLTQISARVFLDRKTVRRYVAQARASGMAPESAPRGAAPVEGARSDLGPLRDADSIRPRRAGAWSTARHAAGRERRSGRRGSYDLLIEGESYRWRLKPKLAPGCNAEN